jgi:hypothetical protein
LGILRARKESAHEEKIPLPADPHRRDVRDFRTLPSGGMAVPLKRRNGFLIFLLLFFHLSIIIGKEETKKARYPLERTYLYH